MRNLRLMEMMLINSFGCPELKTTTERLQVLEALATNLRTKKTLRHLAKYLNEDGVAEWYEKIYYDIIDRFSPDDGTRPPGAGAMPVIDDSYFMAA